MTNCRSEMTATGTGAAACDPLLLTAPKPMLMLPAPKQPLLLEAWATVRVFSFGGGGQSVGSLGLQVLGELRNPYDYFIFANVGEDSENPETLEYIEKHVKPLCEKHNIKFVVVQKMRGRGKNKQPETLLESINRDNRSVPIPAYMSNSGAPGNRSCTQNFKIEVVDKWIKAKGYKRAIIGLGISTDELKRVKSTAWHDTYQTKKKSKAKKLRKVGFWRRREYPLIDLRLSRGNCYAVIEQLGLPIPPKSACWFCPFTKLKELAHMCKHRPTRFQMVIGVENRINEKRSLLGKDRLYISSTLLPLTDAVAKYDAAQAERDRAGQLPLWIEIADAEPDDCDEGVCNVG